MTSSLPQLRRTTVAVVILFGFIEAAALGFFILTVRNFTELLEPGWVGPRAELVRSAGTKMIVDLTAALMTIAIARGLSFALAERAGYRFVQELRMTTYKHLQGMTPRELQYRARGGLILRFTGDLSMYRTWLSRGLLEGSVSLIVLVCGIVLLFWMDPIIACAATAALSLGGAVTIIGGYPMRRSIRSMRRRRSLLTSNIDEQLQSLPVVQVFGRAFGEASRLDRQNASLTRALLKIATQRGWWRCLTVFTGLLPIAAVLSVGLVRVRNEELSLATFLTALLIVQYLAHSVRVIGLAHDYWHRSRVSKRKLVDFLRSSSRPLYNRGSKDLHLTSGSIRFENVSVSGALEGITACITGRTHIAICGPAGAGKSTLLSLIAGLVEADEGAVIVDGQNLEGYPRGALFGRVGYVSPDLPLMRGTVLRNITYGRPRATEQEILRVILATSLDTVLSQLSDGINTWITESGRNLSFGQRQLICLARAIMGNPRILLLDEPSLGLDEATMRVFESVLDNYSGTVVVTTNDPRRLAAADEVWYFDSGRLIRQEPGTVFDLNTWDLQRATAGDSRN